MPEHESGRRPFDRPQVSARRPVRCLELEDAASLVASVQAMDRDRKLSPVDGRQALHLSVAGLVVLLATVLTACGGATTSTSSSTNSTTAAATGSSQTAESAKQGGGASPAKQVVVPKIVGEHFADAVHALHLRGLREHAPGFTGSDSSTALNGCETILSQAPSPGAKVPQHSTVAIVFGLRHC
jgi:hypothetical protein